MTREILLGAVGAMLALGTSALGDNSLLNPGFEDGLASWTTDHGAIRKSDPLPLCGAQYLMGSTDGAAKSYTYQTLGITSLGFTQEDVDEGRASVDFGGWQSGYKSQQDRGKIELVFRDAGEQPISTVDLGWFYSASQWTLLSGEAALPAETRSITYGFYAERVEGNNNDGYLDNAFLSPAAACYADFTADGTLDLFDFLAFVNAFNAQDEHANCDRGCGLDLFDFLCFTNAFNAGC